MDNKCWVILLDLNVFEEKYEKLKAEFSDALDILTEMLCFNIVVKCLLKVFHGNITLVLVSLHEIGDDQQTEVMKWGAILIKKEHERGGKEFFDQIWIGSRKHAAMKLENTI